MTLDESVLETVAKGEPMDYEKWPGMLEPLLERLDYIVYNVFPMPRTMTTTANRYDRPSPYFFQDPSYGTLSSSKENTPPTDLSRPGPSSSSPSTERVSDSQSQTQSHSTLANNDALPPPLQLLLNAIKSTLKSYFVERPPHTIQRLAELILRPNEHYRTLPAFLRALDRIVSVTSSADTFPLHVQQPNGVPNGDESYMALDNGPGSDEFMGGALLTPIPWLSENSIEEDNAGEAHTPVQDQEPHAVPTTETHETEKQEQHQRQQQQQQETSNTVTASESHTASYATSPEPATSTNENQRTIESTSPDPSEEVPHARGPPVVGVEDVGLQNGRGVEMSLSAEAESNASAAVGSEENRASSSTPNRDGEIDGEGDIVVGDAARNKETTAKESTEKSDLETKDQ